VEITIVVIAITSTIMVDGPYCLLFQGRRLGFDFEVREGFGELVNLSRDATGLSDAGCVSVRLSHRHQEQVRSTLAQQPQPEAEVAHLALLRNGHLVDSDVHDSAPGRSPLSAVD
jgi:hypothetical protein